MGQAFSKLFDTMMRLLSVVTYLLPPGITNGGNREEKGTRKVGSVNGERFEISSIDPSTTLLEFLRSQTPFKSVKRGCEEGGCGACVVLLSKYDPVSDEVEDKTLNSCLTLLCSINGCSIITSEGIGNSKKGFHAIHQRIAGFHASQCGFCTPGMCVSLFTALINADKNINLPDPPPGFSKLSISEAEMSIAGNLCRCTGYRPIVDACKSFAGDVDIEDLGLNSFWHKDDTKEAKASKLASYEPSCQIPTFPKFLKEELKSNVVLDSGMYSWYSPVSITELQGLLDSNDRTLVKLVVSNTSTGYYKEFDPYDKYIDLRNIPELSMVKRDSRCIQIGAALTISKAIVELKDIRKNTVYNDAQMMVFTKVADHLQKIASGSVRNAASVGGNLAMAQRSGFPSDIATVLLAIDAVVEIISGSKAEMIALEEFLERPPLDSRSIIACVKIPAWKQESHRKLIFETYRAAPRPLGNALPYLNAAFLADICRFDGSDLFKVKTIRLAFGAYGTKHAIRARKAEEFLVGKILDYKVLQETMKLVQDTVVPENGISHPSYRKSLAEGFLFEFREVLSIDSQSSIEYRVKEYDSIYSPPQLLRSKQIIVPSTEHRPVGEPIIKSGAALQASEGNGENQSGNSFPQPPPQEDSLDTIEPKAYIEAVSLSANAYYVPDSTSVKYFNYGAAVSEVEVNLLNGGTTILRSDIVYDCGQSLNPAVDLGQIEGAFVQGIGFFMVEEYLSNSDGLVTSDSTWTYKIPTIDTIPKQFNVEVMNSGYHQKCILSSKASGEPPLLLASSVHCATRAAIKEARKQLASWGGLETDSPFQLSVPATMPVVKELCGLNIVQTYLKANSHSYPSNH